MPDDPTPHDLTAADVVRTGTTWGTMLRRGLRKRCPRCGGRGIYDTWFRMKERCPTCGFKFEREEGFFVGAYLINFAITEGLLFVLVMVFVVFLANAGTEGVNVAVPIAVGLVLAVGAPTAFYPYSRTIWSAIDLAMTPLELDEIVAARDHLAELQGEVSGPGAPDGPGLPEPGGSGPGAHGDDPSAHPEAPPT